MSFVTSGLIIPYSKESLKKHLQGFWPYLWAGVAMVTVVIPEIAAHLNDKENTSLQDADFSRGWLSSWDCGRKSQTRHRLQDAAAEGCGWHGPQKLLWNLSLQACARCLGGFVPYDRALSLATQTYLTGNKQVISQASAIKPWFPSCWQAAYQVPLNPWWEKDSGRTWIWNEIVYWSGRSVRLSCQQHFSEKLSVPGCLQKKIHTL